MKNYEKVLELLESRYDWRLTNSLTPTGKKLVKDTLNANQLIEDQIEFEEKVNDKKETKEGIIFFTIVSILVVIGSVQVLNWIIWLFFSFLGLIFKIGS